MCLVAVGRETQQFYSKDKLGCDVNIRFVYGARHWLEQAVQDTPYSFRRASLRLNLFVDGGCCEHRGIPLA